MGKWAVIYSSVTGNTKLVAEKIAAAAGEAELFSVDEAPADLSPYEVVALGYWLRRGGPDPKMGKYLPQVQGANVILFQTHGADPNSEHTVTSYARAAYLLGAGCYVLGTFGCQGKINPALLEKRKQAGDDGPHGGADSLARWQRAATHPDEADLAAAAGFVADMKRKLALHKRYLGTMKNN